MKYEVYIKGEKVKEYPFRLQAIIYLILKGYCYYNNYFGCWLDDRTEIKEIKNG